MIRINLLGTPKPKSKRGGGSAAVVDVNVGGGINPLIKGVVAVVIVEQGNAANGYRLNSKKEKLRSRWQLRNARTRSCRRSKRDIWNDSARRRLTSGAWT